MYSYHISFALIAIASASPALENRSDCQQGYSLCSPSGATSSTTPQIGDADFPQLFDDIVLSSLPASKRALENEDVSSSPLERRAASLCCVESLNCLNMHSLNIPFCYDQFTTNYFLPDNSYGTVVGGAYTSSSGDTANLESGDFTKKDGTTGNIYSSASADKPNTSTLPLPSQFTGTGVGSAIPASVLGDQTVTITTTESGSTVSPTTISGSTFAETVVAETSSVAISTVTSGGKTSTVMSAATTGESTISGSTRMASTVEGTTVSASVETLTTVVPGSASASASSTKKSVGVGARDGLSLGLGGVVGMVVLVLLL